MTTKENESPIPGIVRFLEELAAIEYWNQDYLSRTEPGEFDSLAYAIRQERREEILSLLGTTVGRA
ncbi:MAG: hypothetical protein ABSD75_00035 [Terriglobales bacterium]|jgi:hypothetical protein